MPSDSGALGLYIHLPWCVRKCPYCDFNSHELRGELPAAGYVEALLRDLDADLPLVGNRAVATAFLGGGTPSLFQAEQVEGLLRGVRERLTLEADAEITLEANPGTVEHDSFRAYREAGITRVSLGVQSFDEVRLKALGRIHGRTEAEAALSALASAGLSSFNLDLMYGLPGQTVAGALADLRTAVHYQPPHLSHYQLTLEPNTAFAAKPPALPAEDDCWDMQEAAADLLGQHGLVHYEVSAWSRPGFECRHNLNYWRFGDYLGIGAGAHGKLRDPESGAVLRLAKTRHPKAYQAGQFLAETRRVEGAELVFEYFLNALRLNEAITPQAFNAATGLGWEATQTAVERSCAKGLLEPEAAGSVRVTELGRRFLNDLQAEFLP